MLAACIPSTHCSRSLEFASSDLRYLCFCDTIQTQARELCEQYLRKMEEGTTLTKMQYHGGKPHERFFKLSVDRTHLLVVSLSLLLLVMHPTCDISYCKKKCNGGVLGLLHSPPPPTYLNLSSSDDNMLLALLCVPHEKTFCVLEKYLKL